MKQCFGLYAFSMKILFPGFWDAALLEFSFLCLLQMSIVMMEWRRRCQSARIGLKVHAMVMKLLLFIDLNFQHLDCHMSGVRLLLLTEATALNCSLPRLDVPVDMFCQCLEMIFFLQLCVFAWSNLNKLIFCWWRRRSVLVSMVSFEFGLRVNTVAHEDWVVDVCESDGGCY